MLGRGFPNLDQYLEMCFIVGLWLTKFYGNIRQIGDVDGLDFAVFSESFGIEDCTRFREGDFNADCRVDGNDLSVFAEEFGRVPL